jgi:hypothetical protein
LVHPGGAASGPSSTDIEAALRYASAQQRTRLVEALREIQVAVDQIQGRH